MKVRMDGEEDGGSVREHAHGTSYLGARNQHLCNAFRNGRESRCAQSYCTRLSRISYILLHESCCVEGERYGQENASRPVTHRHAAHRSNATRDARLLTISFRVGMGMKKKEATEIGARKRE